jgi:hypothetical protein
VSGLTGLPQINLTEAEAEGSYVRFFEQAFEWDQISKSDRELKCRFVLIPL